MKLRDILAAALIAGTLAACGGGGGSPGLPPVASSTPGSTTTQEPAAAAKMTVDVIGGSGASTASISAAEIAQVKAVLKNAQGAPVPGTVVTFSEVGGSLLSFAPTSKTALTDETGTAVVEIRAASNANLGATSAAASAQVGGETTTAQKAIAITNASSTGAVDPQVLAASINFLDVNPADKSIVLAGSGGNGRLESATLRFRIVDANNSPVKGAQATFTVTPANDVTLNIPSAVSDSEGVVVTTVSSKTVATAVVVKAAITGKSVSTQSDLLTVTTGVATQAGFDLSASKYNMNANITGDKSTLTVRIRDANGNPVADGVPVVFTAAGYGAVGSSTRGGCVTSGGACSVDYIVQDPRPADGVLAIVTAATQLGDGSSIGKPIAFRIVDIGNVNVFNEDGDSVTDVNPPEKPFSCAPQTLSDFAVGTQGGFPPAAGTTITLKPITSGLKVTLKSTSPVADQLSNPPSRVPLDFELDLSALTAVPCTGGVGGSTAQALFDVEFEAGGVMQTRRLKVNYR